MDDRIPIFRETFGPIKGSAGAVFSGDVLRTTCGQIMRPFVTHDPYFLSERCLCGRFGCMAFAEPSPCGWQFLLGALFRRQPPKARPCPTCGARAGEPCRGRGLLLPRGFEMNGFHRARKRAVHSV